MGMKYFDPEPEEEKVEDAGTDSSTDGEENSENGENGESDDDDDDDENGDM